MDFDISNLILHKHNFLSEKECDTLIKYYEKNKKRSMREHCYHAVTGLDTDSTFDMIDILYGTKEHELVSSSLEKMINLYHNHTDHAPYIYGSCTFNLNEEYEGGEFAFFTGKKKIKLKRGDALIFPADHYWVHEVKPITKGVRYSTNCFLQSVPDSVRIKLWEGENILMRDYKFIEEDGIMYNIKGEKNGT